MIMTFSPRCETSVAVEWGSPALQAKADKVVHGDGPRAVAAYIRHVLKETRLPLDRIGRHRIILGTSEDGRPASGAINGRNILVVGETQSGKSWVTGLSCEQMILQGYCIHPGHLSPIRPAPRSSPGR